MKPFFLKPTVKALFLFFAVLSSCPAVIAQQKDNTVASIERNSIDNTPKSISFSAGANWHFGQDKEIFSKYLGISGPDLMMVPTKKTVTKRNITTQRYEQYYKGIKIAYAGYTLTGKEDVVHFMTGNSYNAQPGLSPTPAITEGAAFANALKFVGATKYKWQNPTEEAHIKAITKKSDTSYLPKGKLTWIEDHYLTNADRKLHLAYSFNIYAEEPLSRQEVFVDAVTGKILFSNSLLKHTAASGTSRYSGNVPFVTSKPAATYLLYDSTRGSGVHTLNMNNGTSYGAATEITSATNTWPNIPANNIALDAHWGGEKVYDYWLTQHGRLSWDDMDGILLQYVHYGNNYNNAYWDGVAMTYGDGSGIAAGGFSPLTSMDVTAHEIGHGVCEATCNLIYEKESGAMNEGFSDCWAATIENWSNPFEVDAMAKHIWEIGEEIGTEPLRSMNSPLLQGQPSTYGSTNWVNVTSCTPSGGNDYCGVHTNSGLLNYWYYLLTLGASGTNTLGNFYNINPLGWAKSADILYQTELALFSTSTYADARTASINAATVLYGPCSYEVQCVTSAWYAVGVGANFVPCTPQIAFELSSVRVNEKSTATTCMASKTVNIGIRPVGPAITGSSVVANIVIAPTTNAVLGVDYTLSTTSITFPIGDMTTKYFTMTVYDNGAVKDDKHVDLAYTIIPGSSGAVISPVNDSMTVFIDNDDSIPQLGGIQYHTLNAGSQVTCNFTSPFYGSRTRGRAQFLLYASELQAAGVIPGAPISQIAFDVLTKSSTAPFIGYTVSMRNTTTANLGSAFVTGLTQVYNGNHTTNLGIDSIDFNTTTFTWDGTSNVVVQVCYGMNAAAFAANDQVAGIQQGWNIIGDYNASTGAGTGCGLGYSTANQSTARPIMRFKQTVSPAPIETTATSNRVWDVHAGQEVYFYNAANSNVIAGVKNPSLDLGCVTATVTQAGVGFTPAVFSAINRSRKEITITPTTGGATSTYDATIYLTNTELASVAPGTLFLLKTTAPTDATVSMANSQLITPTLITGTNYVGFRASFTGFSRFMLVDGPLCNTPDANITPAGPTALCLGDNVLLNANTGTGLTYQWTRNGSNIAGATDASYTASNWGNYAVIVNQSVCDSTSLPVTVTLDSAYAAPISGGTAVCTGQTLTLTDITPGGVWSSGDPTVVSVSSTGVVSGLMAGVGTISYTTTNACGSATALTFITASAPISVAMIGGTTTLCQGQTSTLSNTTPSGVWSSSNASVASISASGVVTGAGSGTATISYAVTNVSGCVSAATTVVTVNALPATPTITPSGATAFCTGGFVVLNSALVAGISYQWQVGGVDISGATTNAFTASTSGNYAILSTNGAGCTAASVPVTVTVNPSPIVAPSVGISSSPGTTLCSVTTPVTFTPLPTNGGPSPSYQWYVNGILVAAGPTYTLPTPANGDVVMATLTSNHPCAFPVTASSSVTITILGAATPTVNIVATPNDTVCTGDMVTYSTTNTFSGTAPTWLWKENGINVATGPVYTTVPHDGDVLTCTMTSNYSCLATAVAVSPAFMMHVIAPVANTVAITASATNIASGSSVTFTAVAPYANTFQWFINGTPVAGATSSVFVTSALGNGQIVNCAVTSNKMCALPATVISSGITMQVSTGVNTMATANNFTLQPNPNNGSFVIKGSMGTAANTADIAVVDVLGKTIYTGVAQAKNGVVEQQLTLSNTIANGVYFVKVTSGDEHIVLRMVLNR
jgi:Zn-dependent metalloprotease